MSISYMIKYALKVIYKQNGFTLQTAKIAFGKHYTIFIKIYNWLLNIKKVAEEFNKEGVSILEKYFLGQHMKEMIELVSSEMHKLILQAKNANVAQYGEGTYVGGNEIFEYKKSTIKGLTIVNVIPEEKVIDDYIKEYDAETDETHWIQAIETTDKYHTNIVSNITFHYNNRVALTQEEIEALNGDYKFPNDVYYYEENKEGFGAVYSKNVLNNFFKEIGYYDEVMVPQAKKQVIAATLLFLLK